MNTLRLDFINKRAPYLVKENPHAVKRAWKLGFWFFGYFVFFDIV